MNYLSNIFISYLIIMKKRILDNIATLLLIITIIICTSCICNRLDEANWELWGINYRVENIDLGGTVSNNSVSNEISKIKDKVDSMENYLDALDWNVWDILYYMQR